VAIGSLPLHKMPQSFFGLRNVFIMNQHQPCKNQYCSECLNSLKAGIPEESRKTDPFRILVSKYHNIRITPWGPSTLLFWGRGYGPGGTKNRTFGGGFVISFSLSKNLGGSEICIPEDGREGSDRGGGHNGGLLPGVQSLAMPRPSEEGLWESRGDWFGPQYHLVSHLEIGGN